jgi:hypothetical protein
MTVDVRPQWTEKLYRPTGGQDHLGLGSVSSDRILPKLVPGINVLTLHPRYWSFYTFVLDEFWRRDLPRTRRAFVEFYRPCEAIFAVGAQLCDRPEHEQYGRLRGVVGAQKASPYAALDPEAFDPQFGYMDSDLGGYGLYYATTIAAMGLIAPALAGTNLSFDAPTPEGRIVAAGFRSAVADTVYYREYFADSSRPVPYEAVRDYIRRACLCQLQTAAAPDRELLRDVFLHAGAEDAATTRRATLRFLLDLAHQSDGTRLDENDFRQLIYFRAHPDGATYRPQGGIERTARRWRLYQAREYYSYALNRLWAYLCAWGLDASVGGSRPVPLATLWEHTEAALDFASLAASYGIADPGFSATTPIVEVATWAGEVANVAGTLDDGWDVQAPLHEHELYWWSRGSGAGPTTLPGMAVLLLLVAARLGSPATAADHGMDWDLVTEGGVARLAMSRFFVQLRRRSMAQDTIGELLGWLYRDYVIRQHQQVAVTKLPDDTYRFRREGDRLRFFQQRAEAFMNSSRFDALSTTVQELGFIQALGNDTHALSDAGRQLLDQGDLPDRPLADALGRQEQP